MIKNTVLSTTIAVAITSSANAEINNGHQYIDNPDYQQTYYDAGYSNMTWNSDNEISSINDGTHDSIVAVIYIKAL